MLPSPPLFFFFLMTPPPPKSPLFPYTTLFRSEPPTGCDRHDRRECRGRADPRADACRRRDGERQCRDRDRKSTRLNSSHMSISYAVFCLKKKKKNQGLTIKEMKQYESQ